MPAIKNACHKKCLLSKMPAIKMLFIKNACHQKYLPPKMPTTEFSSMILVWLNPKVFNRRYDKNIYPLKKTEGVGKIGVDVTTP